MCKKNWNKDKSPLRTAICNMEIGQMLVINNNPIIMPLSSIRVTASTVSTDLGRKYSVAKEGDLVKVTRNS
ncbi:MAG: hypothetical protein NC095_07860 [Muribaculum sp.]|nr:hypothetical protein [Muribaculum sp.]